MFSENRKIRIFFRERENVVYWSIRAAFQPPRENADEEDRQEEVSFSPPSFTFLAPMPANFAGSSFKLPRRRQVCLPPLESLKWIRLTVELPPISSTDHRRKIRRNRYDPQTPDATVLLIREVSPPQPTSRTPSTLSTLHIHPARLLNAAFPLLESGS